MKIKFKGLIILSAVLLLSSSLMAGSLATSNYNYINDLIGGRATGMAGAYTAISDDPSGAFYNPAGIVFAMENQVSLSVNSYRNKNVEFEKAISDNSYTQDISSFYPSLFGVIQSLGPVKIAITIININNDILDQDDYFTGIDVIIYN